MLRFSLGLLAVSLQALPPASAADGTPRKPESFLFTSAGELAATAQLLARSAIGVAQVVYNWRRLEPKKGRYDFSAIERDFALVDGIGKMLVIQVQDRFFLPTARNVPDDLLNEAEYGGGLVSQFDNPG